jgi:diaminopimelate epimerase
VRTYERGVENETLSCGTGVVASAISFYKKNGGNNNFVDIKTKGGNLKVDFFEENNIFYKIFLTGPASFVFKGEIEI